MVGALDFRDAVLVFDRICRFLKEAKDECSIIQIGASSGKDIVYFAKKISSACLLFHGYF